jgi:hypothetical protein
MPHAGHEPTRRTVRTGPLCRPTFPALPSLRVDLAPRLTSQNRLSPLPDSGGIQGNPAQQALEVACGIHCPEAGAGRASSISTIEQGLLRIAGSSCSTGAAIRIPTAALRRGGDHVAMSCSARTSTNPGDTLRAAMAILVFVHIPHPEAAPCRATSLKKRGNNAAKQSGPRTTGPTVATPDLFRVRDSLVEARRTPVPGCPASIQFSHDMADWIPSRLRVRRMKVREKLRLQGPSRRTMGDPDLPMAWGRKGFVRITPRTSSGGNGPSCGCTCCLGFAHEPAPLRFLRIIVRERPVNMATAGIAGRCRSFPILLVRPTLTEQRFQSAAKILSISVQANPALGRVHEGAGTGGPPTWTLWVGGPFSSFGLSGGWT